MGKLQDLSSVLTGLYDQPLLGPKPDQLLIFKRPQLALKLQGLLQPATSAAAKHSNLSVVNQAIAAMYEHPALHDHVAGWAPVRSGQYNAKVHLSFEDASAQHRQQLASAGTIQLTMHGAAAPVTLPVSTVASKQLPDVTFGLEYTVVSEYGGDASGDIAAAISTWCRSDVCIAELRAPVSDAKLAKLPSAFTCFQPALEQQGLVPDDEPLLTAFFPLPGGITSLPIVEGPPAALARLHPAPSSAAKGLGSPPPVASSSRASMPDAASPLAGKRRGPESVSNVDSLGAAEALSADSLALVPLTPDDSHAPSLRRSSRDYKKPRPYYAASQVEPPDKPSTSKGLQRGFLK
ncbi:TPA: hypothetical protein ACH3X2_012531 [Trebouxia sp. C0005]